MNRAEVIMWVENILATVEATGHTLSQLENIKVYQETFDILMQHKDLIPDAIRFKLVVVPNNELMKGLIVH